MKKNQLVLLVALAQKMKKGVAAVAVALVSKVFFQKKNNGEQVVATLLLL